MQHWTRNQHADISGQLQSPPCTQEGIPAAHVGAGTRPRFTREGNKDGKLQLDNLDKWFYPITLFFIRLSEFWSNRIFIFVPHWTSNRYATWITEELGTVSSWRYFRHLGSKKKAITSYIWPQKLKTFLQFSNSHSSLHPNITTSILTINWDFFARLYFCSNYNFLCQLLWAWWHKQYQQQMTTHTELGKLKNLWSDKNFKEKKREKNH